LNKAYSDGHDIFCLFMQLFAYAHCSVAFSYSLTHNDTVLTK